MILQVWQIRGGQHKYRSHYYNFVRENEGLQRRLPLLPSECSIDILRRRGAPDPNDTGVFEDFRVRRNNVQQWLNYLRNHHPTFQNPDIQIDDNIIQQLPEDGLVHDQLLNLTTTEIDPEQDQGPPEDADNQPPTNLNSEGFVPDLHIGTQEIEQFAMLHMLPLMVQFSPCQLYMVLHFLNMGQTLQSMHSQHYLLLEVVVLMSQGNIRYLRVIGQTIFFNYVVDDLLGTHVFDTGLSILFCDMKQRRLQGGSRVSSRAKIPSLQQR
jgi:hypothetical protein